MRQSNPDRGWLASPMWPVLWVLAITSGCAGSGECLLGTRYDGTQCVPTAIASVCGAGTKVDPKTGSCVPSPDATTSDTPSGDSAASNDVGSPAEGLVGTDVVNLEGLLGCTPYCPPTPSCASDGCGGFCGTCGAGEKCGALGVCVPDATCIPECTGRVCGTDGCGGSCGACTDTNAPVCIDGACGIPCVPNCVFKSCGTDACGGSCGTCGAGSSCVDDAQCLPTAWKCAPTAYATGDQCDCGCGAADPDCDASGMALSGCIAFETCEAGLCVSTVAAGWTCAKEAYGNGGLCDCGCGAADPDCADPNVVIIGCSAGQVCSAAGVCEQCVASCKDKVCGTDGCGGSCGECKQAPQSPELACVAGACVDGCLPSPVACATAVCGDDGCGGTCGTCPTNTVCSAGTCVVAPGKSCKGHCKGTAPGGCSCAIGCELSKTCCPDYGDVCQCESACIGKACGPDGCGGTCGFCDPSSASPFCDGKGQCGATCVPLCAGKSCGPNGCGGNCGTCSADATCNDSGACVGPAWTCEPDLYQDGVTCDCGCGLPDPDCTVISDTYGCPKGVGCDAGTGLCKMAICTSTKQCAVPKWCIGHYGVGDGHRRGTCQVPDPTTFGPGMPCAFDTDCASGICGAGVCREACGSDADCTKGAICTGIAVVDGLTEAPLGVVTVCESTIQLAEPCTSQVACGPSRQCLATIDPKDLGAAYRCGLLTDPTSEGVDCDALAPCPIGLVCSGGRCMRACPAGNADCPANTTCGKATLHGGKTTTASDDVMVEACVQN